VNSQVRGSVVRLATLVFGLWLLGKFVGFRQYCTLGTSVKSQICVEV
jgi:hypothetical protein